MGPTKGDIMTEHRIVSEEEWTAARKALLVKEKEFTRARDALGALRRELPWMKVEKGYSFEGRSGTRTLPELFDGRSQLVVYHFMFDPSWDAGCRHCSFWADSFDPSVVHLKHRDATLVAVSRAPYAKLAAYQKRMGWSFDWLSSGGTDFNVDRGVAFSPDEVAKKRAVYNFTVQDPRAPEREGVSIFIKDGTGSVYLTYAAFARGIDLLNTAYNYLDLLPKGRDEGDRGPFWVRRHDEYGD